MYANKHYVKLVLLYAQCYQNGREDVRQRTIKFPDENHPTESTILNVVQQLRETGIGEKYL